MKEIKKIEELIFKGSTGRDIVADVTVPFEESGNEIVNKGKVPVVIFVHGFKGFKDWGHFNLMAKEFAKNGFALLKFNFSHNGGTLDNPIDFPDLEAFGKNDFLKELADLNTIVDVLHGKGEVLNAYNEWKEISPLLDVVDISLVGHSRGGGVSLIFSSENDSIRKLVTWNAVSDFEARMPSAETTQKWEQEGVLYVENARTKQEMPMYYSFFESFSKNKLRLNVLLACEKLKIPTLVIQAEGDLVVPRIEGKSILKHLRNGKGEMVEGSDHVFGAMHPFAGEELPGESKRVISQTIAFLSE